MNNLTIKQKIIIGGILTAMVLFILIYFITNAGNLMGNKDDIEEFDLEEGMLNIEEINEIIEGNEESKELEENNKQNQDKIEMEDNEDIVIHITGEVNKPGIVVLKKNSRIADAINSAGGATKEADLNQINLAYILEDGQKIYVPNKNEKIEEDEYITGNSGNTEKSNNSKEGEKVNINEAMQTELEGLPGIGPSLASRIIEYRETNGKFKKIEDLQNVKGIGDAKFNDIKDKVSI
jgi:competence protein ComEA